MKFYCKCTETDPDFVGALLRVPDGIVVDGWITVGVWACHDCFERHVCDNYSIAVTRDVPYQLGRWNRYPHLPAGEEE